MNPTHVKLALVTFIAGFSAVFLLFPLLRRPSSPIIQGQITYLSGSAWKIYDGRRLELRESDLLSENDQIMTDANSRLVLSLDDGSIVRLDENTHLLLNLLKPTDMKITENLGALYARVAKDSTHRFTILADRFSITSQGTAFTVENQDQVKVKVFDSAVKIIKEDSTIFNVSKDQKWDGESQKISPLTSNDKSDEFITWNLSEDKQVPTPASTSTPPPSPTPKPTTNRTFSSGSITLNGKETVDAILLQWTVDSLDVSKGFKILGSPKPNPTYPEDTLFEYISDSSARSHYLGKPDDGKLWHFRICQAVHPETCGVYSNDMEIKLEK